MSTEHPSAQTGHDEFRGRVVVVTGAGGGIGHAVVEAFAARGSCVVAVGRSIGPLERVLESLGAADGESLAIACDVTVESEVAEMVERVVSRWGRIDVLVNGAGVEQSRSPVSSMVVEEWNRVFATNLTGAMLCAKHVAPVMEAQRSGAIVNVASLGGRIARKGLAAYGASKAAVTQLTRILALELAPAGVRVNAISPGATATPMLLRGLERDGQDGVQERTRGSLSVPRSPIPIGRVALPSEQAAVVVFLASDAASYVTGQVLEVDGGEGLL